MTGKRVRLRRWSAATVGIVIFGGMWWSGGPAAAQGGLTIATFGVHTGTPVDDARFPVVAAAAGPLAPPPVDTATPRSITLVPEVSALGGTPLDPLLPVQLDVTMTRGSGETSTVSRLLTPLTEPDLLAGGRATGAQPIGRQVVQELPGDVVAATAQAYLLDPTLAVVEIGPAVPLLLPVDVSIPTGGGIVTADPARLSCADRCVGGFLAGDTVVLTATPSPDQRFTGWGGACSGSAPTCMLEMAAARSVTASFELPDPSTFGLTVDALGEVAGATISSVPAGIACPDDCAERFPAGTTVVLTAAIPDGAAFDGWVGPCRGTITTCTVSMDRDHRVAGTFRASGVPPPDPRLTVQVDGAITGERVTSVPPGINCPPACDAPFAPGTAVRLSAATPKDRRQVEHWTGCEDTGSSCGLVLTEDRTVGAAFTGPGPPPPRKPGPSAASPKVADDACASARLCTATPFDLVSSLPAWPVLLLSAFVLLLIAVPSTMFDSTVEANYHVVDRQYVRLRGRRRPDLTAEWWLDTPRWRSSLLLVVTALVAAWIYVVAGDSPGTDLADELAILAGATIAFLVVTLATEWPEARRARAHGGVGRIRAKGVVVPIAIVCGIVSANLELDPGYTYGIIAGYAGSKLRARPTTNADGGAGTDEHVEAKAISAGAVATLGLTVVAWLGWWIAKDHGLADDPTLWNLFLAHLLLFVVAAGFGRVAFSYLPIRYFDGELVLRWDYRRWRYLELLGALVAILVFAHGADDYVSSGVFDDPRPAITALLVAVGFAVLSVVVWHQFKRAEERASAPRRDESRGDGSKLVLAEVAVADRPVVARVARAGRLEVDRHGAGGVVAEPGRVAEHGELLAEDVRQPV